MEAGSSYCIIPSTTSGQTMSENAEIWVTILSALPISYVHGLTCGESNENMQFQGLIELEPSKCILPERQFGPFNVSLIHA